MITTNISKVHGPGSFIFVSRNKITNIGTMGETIAKAFLKKKCHEILGENITGKGYELDLVTQSNGTVIHIVEVKSIASIGRLYNLQQQKFIIPQKEKALRKGAEHVDRFYCSDSSQIQFDLVVVTITQQTDTRIGQVVRGSLRLIEYII